MGKHSVPLVEREGTPELAVTHRSVSVLWLKVKGGGKGYWNTEAAALKSGSPWKNLGP